MIRKSTDLLHHNQIFITNNTAKIQLKILGRTFRLTSGAIVNAKKLTLCWALSHDAKNQIFDVVITFFNSGRDGDWQTTDPRADSSDPFVVSKLLGKW